MKSAYQTNYTYKINIWLQLVQKGILFVYNFDTSVSFIIELNVVKF